MMLQAQKSVSHDPLKPHQLGRTLPPSLREPVITDTETNQQKAPGKGCRADPNR